MRKWSHLIIFFCAAFFCAELGYGQVKGAKTLSFPAQICSLCDNTPKDSLFLYIRAYCLNGVDAQSSLDTFRLYVERHPYATHQLGQVLDAISSTLSETAQLSHDQKKDFIDNYNWLLKIMPLNNEASFQYTVLGTLASTLEQINLNDAANMWWNISILYPDTGSVSLCWRYIRSIRSYQKDIPQDTTPFHKLTFPLQQLPGGSSGITSAPEEHVTFSIVPNPVRETTVAEISTTISGTYTLQLFDLLGKKVRDIFSEYIEFGKKEIPLDLSSIAKGEYYFRMTCPTVVKTLKLIHE